MIPNVQVAETFGDLGGEKVKMVLDPASTAYLMSTLTKLYSNEQEAALREYSCNALDSHKEAGQTKPVEVSLPSYMSPYLIVKDYGVGLNADGIRKVYSLYGASTKRESNTQTGMLGLGSKSALSMANQFTIVGVKSGVKTTAVASRTDDGTAMMEIVAQVETDEPNGVTIKIPSDGYHNWAVTASKVFRFWPEGSVLVDNRPHERMPLEKLADQVYIAPRGVRGDWIVMGSVAYPVKDTFFPNVDRWRYTTDDYRSPSIVAFVDMGEVNFTPSREELYYTDRTKDKIVELAERFKEKYQKDTLADIAKCTNRTEVAEVFANKRSDVLFPSLLNGITYKGETIPMKHKVESWFTATGGSSKGLTTLNFDDQKRTLFIKVPQDWKPYSARRALIWRYAAAHKYGVHYVSPFINDVDDPWTEGFVFAKWEDIKEWGRKNKLPRNSPEAPRNAVPAYPCDNYGTVKVEHSPNKITVYADDSLYWEPDTLQVIKRALPNIKMYKIYAGRLKKFKELYPEIPHVKALLEKRIDEFKKGLTHDDIFYLTMHEEDRMLVSRLGGCNLTLTGKLLEYYTSYQQANKTIKNDLDLFATSARRVGVRFERYSMSPPLGDIYPMLRHVDTSSVSLRDVVEYTTMKDAA